MGSFFEWAVMWGRRKDLDTPRINVKAHAWFVHVAQTVKDVHSLENIFFVPISMPHYTRTVMAEKTVPRFKEIYIVSVALRSYVKPTIFC